MLTRYDLQVPSGWFPVQPDELINRIGMWHPPNTLVNVLGLFGTVVLIYYVAYLMLRPRSQPRDEGDMARHFRDAHIRFIVGEGVTEFVEEAVFKEKITRTEATDIYNKFGHTFSISDLLPKKKTKQKLSRGETEHLKEQIKERIQKQTIANVVPIKPVLGRKLKSQPE
jgi:hypothetical protein